jgi:sec-independent protein translocase protein TatA
MQEVLIGAAVIFLLFGASRLPQLAKALGQSKKAFKEGLKEGELDDVQKPEITSGQSDDTTKV